MTLGVYVFFEIVSLLALSVHLVNSFTAHSISSIAFSVATGLLSIYYGVQIKDSWKKKKKLGL